MASTKTAQAASNGGDGSHRPQPQARRRVLMLPLPFQGHFSPMLQLADALHGRGGLDITILHHDGFGSVMGPALRPEFTFVAVPNGIPADVAASGNVIAMIVAMNDAMEAPSAAFRDVLAASLLGDEACLFVDFNLFSAQKAARELGLPTLVLHTGSAACFSCLLAYPMLHQKGYLPPRESQLYTPVKELPPLRVRDLFLSPIADHEMLSEFFARATQAVRNYSGLVINTFEALETDELERIRSEVDVAVAVFAAGPFHKLSKRSTGSSSLLHEDRSCIEWLDTQAMGLVLYVSFGSMGMANMDSDELSEVAWGLANSGQPFLWVVRRVVVARSEGSGLPYGFGAAVEGRGKIIPWAPQQEVLAHPAVGGFWTHNGWNSTLESISEGLPMICTPLFADQMMNTRYVEAAWGVGFQLDGKLDRNKIEDSIRKHMKGSEGKVTRERASELKKKVVSCLKSGGSSLLAIDKLIEHISSL